MKSFPLYKCHKTVEAFKIFKIVAQARGTAAGEPEQPEMVAVPYESGVAYEPTAQKTEYVLRDKSGDFEVVVDEDFMERHGVHTTGYFVRYENGHQSFSPASVFEDGYTLRPNRRVLHITLGSDEWEPTIEDMQAVCEMFTGAIDDVKGAIISTRHGVELEILETVDTDVADFVVANIYNEDQLEGYKAKVAEAPTEIQWWTIHVWPEGEDLPESNVCNLHISNDITGARRGRGHSVNRVVLHGGLTEKSVNPEVVQTLYNTVKTYEMKTESRVKWEIAE